MAGNTSKLSMAATELAGVCAGDSRPTLVLEPTSLVVTRNAAARRLLPEIRPDVILLSLATDVDETKLYLRRCGQTTGPVIGTLQIGPTKYRCDGGRVEVSDRPLIILRLRQQDEANAVFNRLNTLIARLNTELGQRRRSEAELKSLLSEKQLLLAELHHRVKNNLAVILSMINLASRSSEQGARQIFIDLYSRVAAISTVHGLLYGAAGATDVSLEQLLVTLTSSIKLRFSRENIDIRIETSRLRCPPDLAVSLALIVNELVTNAVKHAFVHKPEGTIVVSLRPLGGHYWKLAVTDDGLSGDLGRRGSGLTIVNAIAAQLRGKFEATLGPPKRFEVTFELTGSEGAYGQ